MSDELPNIANIDIQLTLKSAKKHRSDNKSEKMDMKYSLMKSDQNVLPLVRKVIEILKEYVSEHNPEYFSVVFYGYCGNERSKRENLYMKVMNSLGYELYERDKEKYRTSEFVILKRINGIRDKDNNNE